MNLNEVVAEAIKIIESHTIGAGMDEGFDAGEFSGPEHDKQLMEEIKVLVEKNGFTVEQVEAELSRLSHEEDEKENRAR